MKILVTGGAGFLGSHLSEKLLYQGHQVICLDNFHTGSKKNIEHLLLNDNFSLLEGDVRNQIDIQADGIFNLACPASPVHYQRSPIETLHTNIFGASNILDLAKKNGARVLQASTSEVYGDPDVVPQPETYLGNVNPIGIRACYDEGKRAAETLFSDYRREFGTDIRIARIFNTYGPRMAIDDGRVISNFIVQALEGHDITIYGDGTQIRSFCYVDDLVDGLISLFFAKDLFLPMNLGNPTPVNMLDLASEIIKLTNSKSQLVYRELPSDDPVTRVPDIALAKRLIAWEPKIQRQVGLTRTVSYFRELLLSI
jgi:UDP-glucuronate decarboxylase